MHITLERCSPRGDERQATWCHEGMERPIVTSPLLASCLSRTAAAGGAGEGRPPSHSTCNTSSGPWRPTHDRRSGP